jgi:hypothetical protein
MRYVYLGDRLTDPALRGQPCDPVRRADGRCIRGRGAMLVTFPDGLARVVIARRLRLTPDTPNRHGRPAPAPHNGRQPPRPIP